MKTPLSIVALAAAAIIADPAGAQEPDETEETEAEAAEEETDEAAGENAEETVVDPDESADLLNSQQQLRQTYTLRRKIDGQVVETKQETVILDPDTPYRATEAGVSTLEQIRASFDSQVLTRVEAFEEAKLDFTIADIDRDGQMTAEEFAFLVQTWRETGAHQAPEELVAGDAPQPQAEAIFEAASSEEAAIENAKAKFAFISGAAPSLSRADYIREYLLDFDAMDLDDDTVLKGDELVRFRAANRGENVSM